MSAGEEIAIRPVHPPVCQDDARAIARIYGHYVLHGTAPFEEVPPTVDEMRARIARLLERNMPILVAEAGGRVVGYALAGPYRDRAAYRHTVEDSVYLAPRHEGSGIGRRILSRLIAECRDRGFRQIVSIIGGSENHASVALHRRADFRLVGVFERVGVKFGRALDTVLMQLDLTANAPDPGDPGQ